MIFLLFFSDTTGPSWLSSQTNERKSCHTCMHSSICVIISFFLVCLIENKAVDAHQTSSIAERQLTIIHSCCSFHLSLLAFSCQSLTFCETALTQHSTKSVDQPLVRARTVYRSTSKLIRVTIVEDSAWCFCSEIRWSMTFSTISLSLDEGLCFVSLDRNLRYGYRGSRSFDYPVFDVYGPVYRRNTAILRCELLHVVPRSVTVSLWSTWITN